MSEVELVIRVISFTELALLSLILFIHSANNRVYFQAGLLFLGICAYLIAPLIVRQWQWGAASSPVILLAVLVPTLFWYFACAVFIDKFVPRPRVKLLALATVLLGLGAFCNGTDSSHSCRIETTFIPIWVSQVTKLLWLAAAFFVVLKDWQADLVESRRRLRQLLVIGGGVYIAVILIVELFIPDPVPAALELLNTSLLLAVATALCLHMLNIKGANILNRMVEPAPPISQNTSTLATQVVALMENDRAFATDELTISSLADRLRTQSHKLRQVINGELGYRNFNTFINLYRIKEVAHRLEQEEYSSTPLLTLALDAGFRSLAPFNRSFKDQYGVTPSEYRQNLKKDN